MLYRESDVRLARTVPASLRWNQSMNGLLVRRDTFFNCSRFSPFGVTDMVEEVVVGLRASFFDFVVDMGETCTVEWGPEDLAVVLFAFDPLLTLGTVVGLDCWEATAVAMDARRRLENETLSWSVK